MADRSVAIPAPEADDPDDVVVALETAGALWGIGEKEEAVRRVRRAAEGAEQAGNDLRAVKLARTAADLASEIQTQSASAGSTPTPPPGSNSRPATPAPPPASSRAGAPISDDDPSGRPSLRPHPPPPSRSSTSPSRPAPASSAPQASRSPLPSQKGSSVVPSGAPSRPPPSSGSVQTNRPSATPSRRPPPPSSRQRPTPPPLPPEAAATPPVSSMGPTTPPLLPYEEATPPPPSSRSRATPPPLPEEPPPSTRHSRVTSPGARPQTERKAPPAQSPAAEPDVWHALRVSVEPSVRDPNLFIVRRLEASKPAPHGTREALIVVVESSADLLGAPETRGPGSSARH